MNKKPMISVILPVYNTPENFLREAIDSILQQTFSDFELIILNDGSTNNAEEVIKSYQDKRIVYTKHENMRLPKTLNKGLDMARGTYIARMDADDISLPQRFEKQIQFLEQHPEISLVGCNFETFPEKKTVNHLEFPGYLDFLYGSLIGHPTAMWRRADFEKYDLRYQTEFFTSEDYDLWSRAVRYVRAANVQEVLLKYRVHGESLTGKKSDVQACLGNKIRKNMLDFLTFDEKLRCELLDLMREKYSVKKKNNLFKYLMRQIFAIQNYHNGFKKSKRLTILGFKINLI